MKSLLHTALFAGLLVLCNLAIAEGPSRAPVKLDIAAQPISDALNEFARQADLQVFFLASEESKRLMSTQLTGTFKPNEALTRLLSNTGLNYEYLDARTIAIRSPKASAKSTLMFRDGGNADGGMFTLAQAKTTDTKQDKEKVKQKGKSKDTEQEVVVEDTRIKPYTDVNADLPRTVNDVQPYYIYDSKMIEESGAITVEDFLQNHVTMNQYGGLGVNNSTNTTSYGSNSGFSLRGLGVDRTLILINGRRAPSTVVLTSSYQSDVNGIAPSTIERIEVLPTSASAIYGGNAIGGVINIVLKRGHRGGEVQASYSNTLEGDATRRGLNLNYGFGLEGGRTNLSLSGQYSDGNPIRMNERGDIVKEYYERARAFSPSFLSSPINPYVGATTNIANSVNAPLVFNAANGGGTMPSSFTYVPYGMSPTTSALQRNAALLANAGRYNYDLPTIYWLQQGLGSFFGFTPTIKAASASVNRRMTSRIEAYMDVSFNRDEGKSLYSGFFNSGRTIPVSTPTAPTLNPFTTPIVVKMPAERLRPRIGIFDRKDLTTGVKLDLPGNWIGMVDYSHTRNENTHTYEATNNNAVNNAFASGAINPFVDTNLYPVSLDPYASYAEIEHASRQDMITVRFTGPFLSLPWGRPTLTLGLENRIGGTRDGKNYSLSPQAPTSESLTTYFGFKQVISSVFTEALIPLVATDRAPGLYSLELQLVARFDKFKLGTGTSQMNENLLTGVITYGGQTIGGQPFRATQEYDAVNPSIGFKYQPIEALILRASFSTGFQPPTNSQMQPNPEPSPGTVALIDPLHPTAPPLPGPSYNTVGGGNPDIKPQDSESLNAGLIWEPRNGVFKNLRFSADYYSIDQSNAIGTLGIQELVNLYPDRITRNSAGVITEVNTSNLNLYARAMRGWDLTANYRLETNLGAFGLRGSRSVVDHATTQISLTAPSRNDVGHPIQSGVMHHQTTLYLSWEHANWSAGWTSRLKSWYNVYGRSTTSTYALAMGNGGIVPAQDFHDATLIYRFPQTGGTGWFSSMTTGSTVILGMKNVFDTAPAFDTGPDKLGFMSALGDLRGRELWMNLRKSF